MRKNENKKNGEKNTSAREIRAFHKLLKKKNLAGQKKI